MEQVYLALHYKDSRGLLRPYEGTIESLEGSIKALLRLYEGLEGSMKAL